MSGEDNDPVLEFWFDFASTYSYLTAMRIEEVAKSCRVSVIWKPFLLGPIFAEQGWTSSPFNLYPAKGRYMARDVERIAKSRGIPFTMPDPFPQHSVAAARLALTDPARSAALAKAIFRAEFAERRNISDPATLRQCLEAIGAPAEAILSLAATDAIKSNLRSNTQMAQDFGIFGAPTLRTADGEIFWGDDRLEQAVSWAQHL